MPCRGLWGVCGAPFVTFLYGWSGGGAPEVRLGRIGRAVVLGEEVLAVRKMVIFR